MELAVKGVEMKLNTAMAALLAVGAIAAGHVVVSTLGWAALGHLAAVLAWLLATAVVGFLWVLKS